MNLFKSRKFWMTIVGVVANIVTATSQTIRDSGMVEPIILSIDAILGVWMAAHTATDIAYKNVSNPK